MEVGVMKQFKYVLIMLTLCLKLIKLSLLEMLLQTLNMKLKIEELLKKSVGNKKDILILQFKLKPYN